MKNAKKIIAAALTLTISLSLAACGGGGTTTSTPAADQNEPAGPIEIVYWYSWKDKIQENNENLVKRFNETIGKEQGIKVTAEYQGTYDDLHQKLQAAHVANNTPDIAVMEIASIKNFAENGVITALDTFINQDAKEVNMDDFYPGLMTNSYVEKKCYGLPYLRSTPILYLNTTMLTAAGLDPTGPKTWDELAQYCETIKEKTGKYGMTSYCYDWTFEGFIMQNGSTILSADETTSNINTPAVKEVFAFFKDLKDRDLIRIVSGADSSKVEADIINQNCAMWYASTGNLSIAKINAAENGYDVSVAFMPKNVQYGVPTGGCNLVIAENISPEKKAAAWTFMKFMTAPEQAMESCQTTGYVSTRASVTDSPAMAEFFKTTPEFKVALDQLAYGAGRPMNPGYNEARKEMIAAMESIWVNDGDIDTVCAETETKMNKALASK